MSEFDDDDLAAAFDDEFDDNDGDEVSISDPDKGFAEHQRNSLQLQFPADHFRHSVGLLLWLFTAAKRRQRTRW